ncbi:MAG: DUF1684 domain-containing protein [Candidatus Lutacidiplasmatales archaeon]
MADDDAAYRQELEYEREMKDQFMAHHPESPFVAEQVSGFESLHYFPIDLDYRVQATLGRKPAPSEAYLRTNRDGQAVMRYIGDLSFALKGRRLQLRVYHAGEGVGTSVFVPFRDTTSGKETYGPGRYLTLELAEEEVYTLDFNRAFNPYCAYTDAFECGFPPAENDLPVPVPAGEKVWSVERNPRTPSSVVKALLPPPAASKKGGAKGGPARPTAGRPVKKAAKPAAKGGARRPRPR